MSISHTSPSPYGGTKRAEYIRTIELFRDIYDKQDAYYAFMFLVDSGYQIDDIRAMADIIKPKNN